MNIKFESNSTTNVANNPRQSKHCWGIFEHKITLFTKEEQTMSQVSTQLNFSLAACALLMIVGCTGESPTPDRGPETTPPPATVDMHGGHDHPSEGPHHGSLIELGDETYHAELLHDEKAKTVTIYILDGSATKQIPIEATEITINAKYDGKPVQFTLAATPDEADPENQSSRFVSDDETLTTLIDEDGSEPRLVLTIRGKSYRGTITHSHDHAGHDH